VFRALIEVKGVGPRAAQNILSGIEAKDLAAAVAQGDVARLTKVPGVGKKTAERLVVELREKLAVLARAAGPARIPAGDDFLEQLRQALVNLGYKAPQAEGAVDRIRPEAEGKALDELLRDALKVLRG
jgi:Holliday junction DNA helicase RuvA